MEDGEGKVVFDYSDDPRIVISEECASIMTIMMQEVMSVADAGKIMPPKSTWFEPKLRDGMVIHLLEDL